MLSRLLPVIETTPCYRKHLLLSRLPVVIETTSCHPDYLLLSETPLVIEQTSRYRKAFLTDSECHTMPSSIRGSTVC